MRRRCGLLMALALTSAGCAGFDDAYYHDGWVMESYPAASPCGRGHATVSTPPRPAGAPTVTPISASAASPQTREPDLLR